ncbi:Hypothetical predicted protein [Octopus vulgaris]|uniref:Uncharacterized protein n=1 Tax=Octopus vulgaris TaxID=6645 RepID=A0AA36AH12_OCTVU|nr:Hypothetical predicted protein [Octopus vulgaris]
MANPVAVQMNLHPIMDWDSSDVVEEFKKFKQKTQLAFKSFLKGTTDDEKEDLHLALMSLRTTPLRANMKSPAELLNGRKYKTTLPTKIQPPIDQKETRAKLAATQEQAQRHCNKHAYLPEMLGGQHVYTQDPITKTWIPVKVVSRAETPRSNMIVTESGRQLKQQGPHPPNNRAAEENVYNTPQTPVRSRRSTRWRKNILPPVRYR